MQSKYLYSFVFSRDHEPQTVGAGGDGRDELLQTEPESTADNGIYVSEWVCERERDKLL